MGRYASLLEQGRLLKLVSGNPGKTFSELKELHAGLTKSRLYACLHTLIRSELVSVETGKEGPSRFYAADPVSSAASAHKRDIDFALDLDAHPATKLRPVPPR